MSDISLDELSKNATPPAEEAVEEVEEVVEDPIPTIDPRSGMEDPLEAALRRDKEARENALNEQRKMEAEIKEDGRIVDLEVDGGINIGDSLARRLEFANENVRAIQEQIQEEDIEAEVKKTEDEIEDAVDTEDSVDVSDDIENDPMFSMPDTSDDVDDIEEEIELDETEAIDITDEVNVETTKEEKDDSIKFDKKSEEFNPTQSDIEIDDEDLLDLGDLDDDSDDEDSNDDITDEQLDGLKEQIKEKLNKGNKPIEGLKVVKKVVSLSAALNKCSQDLNTIDWPLMSAGKNVTMKAFSGTEIDGLNRSASGRNRFNTMKEIYRNLYDHIVSEKPEFEEWLKVISFMDIEHLYMAAYKASFNGANYIPYNCTNDKCNHVFLSDDIDILDMCKFKNDEAKKRFMAIYENDTVASPVEAKLYATTIVPVSDTIAIGFREPSIYNTIFENSVLDAKFVDKYTQLLTMMVYIDNIYLIDGNEVIPINYKKDKQSVARTTKYRIATYAKIIRSLPSDAYNKIIGIISQINELGDEVQYCLPEITCPKCGETIEESITPSNNLLFSRHQLNLLSQQ